MGHRRSVTILLVLAFVVACALSYAGHDISAQDATAVGGASADEQQEETSVPTVTATWVVVTATPTPINVFVAAGIVVEATANAQAVGTATPTPDFWVSATPTATPIVVTSTPIPENNVTATYQARFATAVALTTGTADPNQAVVTATSTTPSIVVSSNIEPSGQSTEEESTEPRVYPTVTPVAVTATSKPTSEPTATPEPPVATPTTQILVGIDVSVLNPTATPTQVYPAQLIGKILFQSRRARLSILGRNANVSFFAIDADGTNLMALRPQWNWAYTRASARDEFSADNQFRAFVQKEQDYKKHNQSYIFYEFFTYGTTKQVTFFGDSDSFPYTDAPPAHVDRDRLYGAWDPAWSPTDERIALVSNTSGNDEIWVVERDVWPATQLTKDEYGAWDRHPSWSPDGSQIVFFSTRSGDMQLWIMDADGGNQRQLTFLENEAWNPVWVKYPDS